MPAAKLAPPKRPDKLPKKAASKTACNGRKADGTGYCGQKPGWGTKHPGRGRCKRHGGATKLAGRGASIEIASEQVETYGLPREIDPHRALLEELERTAGHVSWLFIKVQEIGGEDADALVGPVGQHGPSESGGFHHPSIEPSVWLKLYQGERKHLIDIAKACIAAGIEERRVQLAEQQGELMARVIKGILKELKVDNRPETPAIVRRHLTMIQGEASS